MNDESSADGLRRQGKGVLLRSLTDIRGYLFVDGDVGGSYVEDLNGRELGFRGVLSQRNSSDPEAMLERVDAHADGQNVQRNSCIELHVNLVAILDWREDEDLVEELNGDDEQVEWGMIDNVGDGGVARVICAVEMLGESGGLK